MSLPYIQQAESFVQRGEDLNESRNYAEASECHYRAAELYLLSMNDTDDTNSQNTLKLLYLNHNRIAKELKKKELKPNSNKNLEENSSFLLLENNSPKITRKSVDPFEKFWDQVEGLVVGGAPAAQVFTAQIGQSLLFENPVEESKSKHNALQSYLNLQYSYIQQPDVHQQSRSRSHPLNNNKPNNNNLLQSYLIVDTQQHPKTMEEYELENEQLKKAVNMLSIELSKLERTATDNHLLQSSILEFRQQVNQNKLSTSNEHEVRLTNLVKQNAKLLRENNDYKIEIERYKTRWEKLKELNSFLIFIDLGKERKRLNKLQL
jgi:hypothetical protein